MGRQADRVQLKLQADRVQLKLQARAGLKLERRPGIKLAKDGKMSVQSDRGARHERRTAAALGAVRVGNTGRGGADAVSDWAAIECKSRLQLPAWLKQAVKQAEAAAAAFTSAKLPVVVLHQVGGRAGDDLVVIRMAAFRAWFGGWRGDGEVA